MHYTQECSYLPYDYQTVLLSRCISYLLKLAKNDKSPTMFILCTRNKVSYKQETIADLCNNYLLLIMQV